MCERVWGRGVGVLGGGEMLLQFCFPSCVFYKHTKSTRIMESITQPESQVLILAPFPTRLGILGPWLMSCKPLVVLLLSWGEDTTGLIGIIHVACTSCKEQ